MDSKKNSVSQVSSEKVQLEDFKDDSSRPEFIYGGPFINTEDISPFMNTSTPINLQLQGTFKKSFAFYSLKERLPVILTKVIDFLSKKGDEDSRSLIQYITKLKNDLITNKKYDLLAVDTPEAKRWNEWISAAENPFYFTNIWVFSECYVYRRLREGCELSKNLKNFDPFEHQKNETFNNSVESMCTVAEKVVGMLPESDKDKRKADFITLLKLSLWGNVCDLSLSNGASVSANNDPIQLITDWKDRLLVDDTAKIADQVVAKAETVKKSIEGNTTFKYQCSCHRLATLAGVPQQIEKLSSAPTSQKSSPPGTPPPETTEEEPPKIPCPAKMTIPQYVMFDIVCDNAGYELFTDLCLAAFLVSQKIVQKVRFHVKKIPWFVSDVTEKDFKYVIDSCAKVNFKKEFPKPDAPEGEKQEEPRVLTGDKLKSLGETFSRYLDDGAFVVMDDDFWTSPHVYKDMKKYDPNLYRKLQFAVAVCFKGDLNYRKLLGEKNWNPYIGFEPALQGFIPAPVIALRTVKADLICGLPKGKYEQLNKLDEKWMEKGDYGVIQFCPKAEPIKPAERPCLDYGDKCYGTVCPVHTDL